MAEHERTVSKVRDIYSHGIGTDRGTAVGSSALIWIAPEQ
jgi:hypothetical protein